MPADVEQAILRLKNTQQIITMDWSAIVQGDSEAFDVSELQATVTQQIEMTNVVSAYATETATLWTSTPKPRPSNTPIPSYTFTPRPSNTPRPTNTQTTRTYYVTSNRINARACPETTCDIVTTLSRGDEIQVIETIAGTNVAGSTGWYHARYNGRVIYVHSSLASRNRPSTAAPVLPQTSSSGNTATPQNQSVAPPAPASACNCQSGNTLNCSDFRSQSAAQACYNQCIQEVGRDVHGLDGNDNDGLACESL
ncbi:MAG: SH3 domain-containing protein [Anaerolineae bacterium]|nr:SH3 domain-containing protein [Anaerolineae bacterium]MDQ7034322.1 SH3 domain-containing protein [Anaerolineae bacterium]